MVLMGGLETNNSTLVYPVTRHSINPWKMCPAAGSWALKSHAIKKGLALFLKDQLVIPIYCKKRGFI